jgi:hypothetical protein
LNVQSRKALNHVSGMICGVASVYNKFAYLDERRARSMPGRDTSSILLLRKRERGGIARMRARRPFEQSAAPHE